MRSSFKGFYGASEDSIGNVYTSEDTTFIFDANILLTLYRCEEDTRNRFFDIWENIKDKCWLPHHVCLEYQRNRLKTVSDSQVALGKIARKIDSSLELLKKEIKEGEYAGTISRYSNLRGEIDDLLEKIESAVSAFEESHILTRQANIDFLDKHDVIRDKIDRLTEGRIGSAPTEQTIIDELNKKGKVRYEYKVGPGYADANEKRDDKYSFDGINYLGMYGDFYVWSQILEYVQNNKDKNIIYVTNDAKLDFFYKVAGMTRGPNESLKTEIMKAGAKNFLLQNIDSFLHHANSHLNARVDESSINELSNASVDLATLNSKIKWKTKVLSTFLNSMSGEFGITLTPGVIKKYIDERGGILDEIYLIDQKMEETQSVTETLDLLAKKGELEATLKKYDDALKALQNGLSED
ncbi:hypothetical protein SMX82_003969 [Cronobacter sakazakii]|nr:hypothetical protein [Cronobacter sakazakii]